MTTIPWANEFPGNITVCNAAGVILAMNAGAAKSFEKQGGLALVGTNLLDCHPEPSRAKVQNLLASGKLNAYTVEKGGKRELVYQSPWYASGEYRGLVEIVLPLPEQLPHFVRDT